MLKRIISVLLAALITASCVTFAYADNTTARVYSIYSDNMLFKQNEEAIIAGTGEQGAEITVELLLGDSVVSSERSFVGDDGTFCVSFNAPAGGYDTYTVLLKENGTEFKKLENVVFGELWLSSGQSNMQYPLGQEKYGSEMMNKSEKLSPWIRTLIIPAYPEYNGSNELVPYEPQNDIIDARWITGESSEIYGMSAVAYFFAAKMQESLDMPVGILNLSLGGSSIASWLSRDAVDGCDSVKNDFINNNRYIEKSDWKDDEINVYVDMTGNYNLRINPVRHFKLSGMIWYQGESDIGWSGEEYENAFNLMQTSYTKLFNYQNGLLPIVYSQLAAYFYDESGFCLPERNVDFTEIQQKEASSRAVVPIYDIPLTFIPGVGSIHPEHKKEIGERMAFAADGLVYGKRDSYSAPAITASEIKDGAIYVTLNNVGDGLKINGESEEGFAVCGDDGVGEAAEDGGLHAHRDAPRCPGQDDGEADADELSDGFACGTEEFGSPDVQFFIEEGDVADDDAGFDDTCGEGGECGAFDAHFRGAELTEDEHIVQHEVDKEGRARADEADERGFDASEHTHQDLCHGEEDIGETDDAQILCRFLNDVRFVREDGKQGRRGGEGEDHEGAGDGQPEDEAARGGFLDAGDVLFAPVAGRNDDRTV